LFVIVPFSKRKIEQMLLQSIWKISMDDLDRIRMQLRFGSRVSYMSYGTLIRIVFPLINLVTLTIMCSLNI